jgi:hypothetical protein
LARTYIQNDRYLQNDAIVPGITLFIIRVRREHHSLLELLVNIGRFHVCRATAEEKTDIFARTELFSEG